MAARRFRTRPVEIEAFLFTGDNHDEIAAWTEDHYFIRNCGPEEEQEEYPGRIYDRLHDTWINVAAGSWIIRGLEGEYYPCVDSTFRAKYEEVITENQYANGHTYDRT